jgi:hypothetical protein
MLYNSDDFVKADFESKMVICKKFNYMEAADEYDVTSCLFDKKEPSSSGLKDMLKLHT